MRLWISRLMELIFVLPFGVIGGWRLCIIGTVRRCGDVVLSEDSLRSSKSGVSHLLSSLRTLTMNLLHRLKSKNMAAQLDHFADKFSSLIQFMQAEAVL